MKLSYLLFIPLSILFLSCGSSDSAEDTSSVPLGITYPAYSDEFKLTSPVEGSILLPEHKFVVKVGSGLDFNVSKVEYWMDNKTVLLNTATSAPFSLDIDLVEMSNGKHTVQAFAYDEAGNNIASQSVEVVSYAQSLRNTNEFHVSVDGSPQGDGSLENPWDATTAFGTYPAGVITPNPYIKPGDTIWFHGGNYDNASENFAYKTFLVGTQEKPIILRAFGDGIVDIKIASSTTWPTISSAYNWYWGFESSTNNTTRLNEAGVSTRISAYNLDMPGHRIINNVISNSGHPGIGFWSHCADGEVYGTTIWGTGHYENSSSLPIRGSAIYTQNDTDLTRNIRDVIAFRSFTNAVKPYTEQGYVDNFHIEGTIGFKNPGYPIILSSGPSNPAKNLEVINNFTWEEEDGSNHSVALGNGFVDAINTGLTVSGNYFVSMGKATTGGPLLISQWDNVTVENNTLVTRYTADTGTPRMFSFMHSNTDVGFSWDYNTYYGGRDDDLYLDNFINIYYDYLNNFQIDKSLYTLEGWQDYTQTNANMQTADLHSTLTRSYPTANVTFVRPNLYERGRGHVVIYNWEKLDEVYVDISDLGLDEGQEFEVRDVQNYYGPVVLRAVYSHDNSNILLPMTLTEVSPIIGDITHMDSDLTHTDSRFATFVVLPK